MDKFSELKAAAMAATPGPWHVVDQACRWNIDDEDGVPVAITQQRTSTFNDRIQSDRTANTSFIAAANPAVVLALLAELDEAQKESVYFCNLNAQKNERIAELEAIATEYAGKFQKAQDAAKHLVIMNDSAKAEIAHLKTLLATPVRLPDPYQTSCGSDELYLCPVEVADANRLLASEKVTKAAITQALRQLKKTGCDKSELQRYLLDIMEGKQKSSLAFCTDQEAATIDQVIGTVLLDHPGLKYVIQQRYIGRGKSKKAMAADLHDNRPEWCMRTCETRIAVWLKTAEFMLYLPMSDAFYSNVARFYG